MADNQRSPVARHRDDSKVPPSDTVFVFDRDAVGEVSGESCASCNGHRQPGGRLAALRRNVLAWFGRLDPYEVYDPHSDEVLIRVEQHRSDLAQVLNGKRSPHVE